MTLCLFHGPVAKALRILYVGELWDGGTCKQRLVALKELGHNVTDIDVAPQWVRTKRRTLTCRLRNRAIGLGDLAGVNKSIIKHNGREQFDILWLDKALTVDRCTLFSVKQTQSSCLIVGYSPDDMYAKHNQSRQFLQLLPLYNVFFTTKSYNVAELRSLGCPRAEFIGNAFDLNTHRPVVINEDTRRELGGAVGFIGGYERKRATSVMKLAQNGVPVRIWGGGVWLKHAASHPDLRIEREPVWGDRYSEAICSFDINLCFLRKMNRDLQTTRSIEIPACGGFMLAERTDEHSALFEEGKEADFFGSDEELIDKVHFYLARPEQRQRIAAAGRRRCLESGYSNHDRMNTMLNVALTPRGMSNEAPGELRAEWKRGESC